MILKSFQLNKIDQNINIILFYGNNDGQKKDEITKLYEKNKELEKIKYDEKEIISDPEIFYTSIFNLSFFDKKKFILINQATDKILPIVVEIVSKKIEDIKIILNSDTLDKRSKLRNFFEKDKNCLCVPFYPDNITTLTKLVYEYLNSHKLSLSRESINLLINKSSGDRKHLRSELEKIKMLSKNKKITNDQIVKLINLNQEHEITELVNNCLSQNVVNLKNILNENIITNDDCMIIIRTFTNKIKRLIRLSKEYKKGENLDDLIGLFKPPIFWKEKEVVKKQILKWPEKEIKKLLYELNALELIIKQENTFSVHFLTNFILEKSTTKISNI